MKYIMLLAVLLLTACTQEPSYLNNKVLYDMQGCAYIARKNIGDTMFLNYNKELSKAECKFGRNK